MVAFELVENGDANKPSADLAKKLTAKALEKGLVLLSCGVYGNVIRILVPITADDAVVEEGIQIIEKSLKEIQGMVKLDKEHKLHFITDPHLTIARKFNGQAALSALFHLFKER